MIECPFCGETIDEDDLVFEFSWGEVATFFYNRQKLQKEPSTKYQDRSFYVTMNYGWRGQPVLGECSTYVNPQKHTGVDPLTSAENEWPKLVDLLRGRKVFEVECDDDDLTIPTGARILPMSQGRGRAHSMEGVSTGIFCPVCEEQIKPEILRAKAEVRILLSGRPGSGKTVYVTQAISELMMGRLAQSFTIEAANNAVHEHYISNKNRLKAFNDEFVLATNPGSVQSPYIFLLKNAKNSIRLVIQDIAGEDTENRTKYSKAVRKADILLFCVDPWHIEEMRSYHRKNGDQSNAIVERSTQGKYRDLSGVFQQMMNAVDRSFTAKSGQLAGVMLVKGDYLNPPMLSAGDQPECKMMQKPIHFNDPNEMEFSIGMRSSFIRQCMNEWESTRSFLREVEGKYSAHNIRYFVTTALGQSTHLRHEEPVKTSFSGENQENPDDQFQVDEGRQSTPAESIRWDYDEQVMETAARPEHVIDPIFWCLKRKGIEF